MKTEAYVNKVGYSERTDVVIEPRLSLQWWVKMPELAKPAAEAVANGEIHFYPEKFVNTYRHWMDNIKDWCISRQLWWGHRIPAWYFGEGDEDFVVAKTREEALNAAIAKSGDQGLTYESLHQDEDVMDTWFSSWLWPISVFDGFYTEEEVKYYYPTNDLVTGPDIIFFWVARMIMAGYEYRGEKPFSNVYFTGIVRDKLGRKMSKSLGNSPDPLELINEYGADGVRVGLLLTAPAGNDIPFDPKLCEQGRNFSNKIWNAFRLVKGWEVVDMDTRPAAALAVEWMEARFNATLPEINESFDRFRISEALMTTYKLIWDDFCSWYLEMVKPPYGEAIDSATYKATLEFFGKLLKLLHPFMPFISEEIWQQMEERRSPDEALIIAPWPKAEAVNGEILNDFNQAMEVVTATRNFRKEKNIPNKEAIELNILEARTISRTFNPVVAHLCNVSEFHYVSSKPENAFSFFIDANEYFVPFGDHVDLEAERDKLLKEINYEKGFLLSVEKKLSNEKFVNSAPPQVVELEKRKLSDAQERLKLLEEKLAGLN